MATRFVPNPNFIRTIEKQIMRNHKAVGLVAQRQAKKNVRPGGVAGFKRSHGAHGLLGSIGYEVFRRGSVYTTRYGSNQKYAAIHERGDWIRAKDGSALAIPIHRDAKKAKSPRDFGDLAFIERAGRPPLLVRYVGGGRKKARTDIMYVLKKAVFIPARSYLRPTLRQKRAEIIRLLSRPPRSMRKKAAPT